MSPTPTIKLIFAILNILFGLATLIMPRRVAKAVGLDTDNPIGIAELRIGWGGLYLALGLAAVYMRSPSAYWILGAGYGGMALTRLIHLIFLNRKMLSGLQIGLLIFECLSAYVFLVASDFS